MKTKEVFFRGFVAFLFPNSELNEDVIDAVIDNVAEQYIAVHQFDINVKFAVYELDTIFKELEKEEPSEEVINDCLESIMNVFNTWDSPNLKGLKFFRDFDIGFHEHKQASQK